MKSTEMKGKIIGKAASLAIMERDAFLGAEDLTNNHISGAYFRSSSRSFTPSLELDAWLDARAEFDSIDDH